ncbi:bacillithiol biosynthesis deacetylase BshB2 [Paenibacillus harenae]|uniref:bacillithiol biosynthesis deacetylase BshB2 n=1 Tax=Paenibacillus harenae TaxID=306543 RepID=UPI00041A6587|nr:bacillithiol biosynthesis deacetylase BshB2 [Paenibacillus harenae]
MERHILVVLPHPDDEAFGLSGTLAKHIQAGTTVTYACLTLGEMGRNMGIPPFTNRVGLPQIRKRELEEACRAIGIQDLRMLGFHDKTIEFEEPELLDGSISALLEEVKPSLVLTFYPGYAVHPDHDACGAAVVRAVAKLPANKRPRVLCIAFARNHEQAIGRPDVINDVRGFLKQKLAAISAHRSQFQAAELLGSKALTDKELQERYGTERFWTYRFN